MKNKTALNNTKPARKLMPRLLTLLVAGSFSIGPAWANPGGAQVVNGQASFNTSGNVLSVTNTPGAIINWQSFSINPGEVTRFMQQSASSSVLNRIVGQNPSQILGSLQSNGKVFLINPNGIVFGRGAQVDVNGLVASSLQLGNDDFLAGRLNFKAGALAGNVQNLGAITTPNGGQVYLIAPQVENSGVITSPKGDVILAAGRTVQLVDSTNPDLQVAVSAPADQAINLGQVIAQGGKIGIYGALVNQRGIINANSAVVGENGKIVFKASGVTLLEGGSRSTATGAGTGGEIVVLGAQVGLTGDAIVDASGQAGGGTVLVGGDYQGKNASIQNAQRTFVGADAQIKADALQRGDGGKVIVWSDEVTRAYGGISARGGAQGGNGGLVEVSGKQNLDFHARVDVGVAQGMAGKGGTLLLDPATITITGGTGDGDTDGTATFGATTPGTANFADAGPTVIYQSEIEGLAPGTNLVLEATDYIGTAGAFGNMVTLPANSNLMLRTRNAAADGTGAIGINLVTSTDGANLEFKAQGTGTLTLQTGTGSSPQAAGIQAGKLTTAGGQVAINASGNVKVGGITTTPAGSPGGNVDISAGSNGYVFLDGGIDTRPGTSGTSGNVTLSAGAYVSASAVQSIYANELKVSATSGVYGSNSDTGATYDGPVATQIGTLNAHNAGVGAIDIANSGALTIADIGTVGYGVKQDVAGQGVYLTASGEDVLLNVNAAVVTAGGPVVLRASKMALASPINAGPSGIVTLLPATGGAIHLGTVGTNLAANTLELSNAELNQITAGTLRIGDVELSSALDIKSAIAPTGVTTALSLGGIAITQQPGATINVPSLSLRANSGGVTLLEANPTGAIAGSSGLGGFQYRSSGPLNIGTVDNYAGLFVGGNGLLVSDSAAGITQSNSIIATNGLALKTVGSVNLPNAGNSFNMIAADLSVGATGAGAFSVFSSTDLTVDGTYFGITGISTNNRDISLTTGAGATLAIAQAVSAGSAKVALVADTLALNGAVTASEVNLRPMTAGRGITVGSATCDGGGVNCLRLTDLYRINAPALSIGTSNASASPGAIYVAGVTTGGATATDINAATTRIGMMTAGGGVTQGGAITVQNLAVVASGAVNLSQANSVANLAGSSAAGFAFTNAGNLSIATQSGGAAPHGYSAAGVGSTGGNIDLRSSGGNLTVGAPVNAGAGSVTLNAGGAIVGGATVTASSLTATAANGIGHSTPLTTQVGALTASNSGANTDIRINNTGALVLGNVAQTTAASTGNINIDNTGALSNAASTAVSTKAGSITLLARSPLTINGTVASTDGGAINLTAGASGSTADKLTIAASGAVTTSGAITLRAGDAIVVSGAVTGGAVTQTPNTNVVVPPPPPEPPTLAQCTAAPTTPGCSAVLPSLAVCAASPTTPGCSVVLPSLPQCLTNPTLPGCGAVLPTVAACTVTPSLAGCAAVLPSLAQCSVAPTTAGCSAVLPSLAVCTTAPTTSGCSVVLPPLSVCASRPTTAGCGAVLPSLSQCLANPVQIGCGAVLPSLTACTANPTQSGCAVVLPSLAQCSASPTAPGCGVVLPTVAQCTALPTMTGCQVVLPSLAQCVGAPTVPGCSAVLPRLAQCTLTPTLAGCSVVLPPVSACAANPSAPGCQVVLPPTQAGSPGAVGTAINTTINIISTASATAGSSSTPKPTVGTLPTSGAGFTTVRTSTVPVLAQVFEQQTIGGGSDSFGGSSTPGADAPNDKTASASQDKKDEKKEEEKGDAGLAAKKAEIAETTKKLAVCR